MSDVHKGYDIGKIIRQCQNQPVMDRLTMCLMDMTTNSAPVYRKILGSGALLSLNLDYVRFATASSFRLCLALLLKCRNMVWKSRLKFMRCSSARLTKIL